MLECFRTSSIETAQKFCVQEREINLFSHLTPDFDYCLFQHFIHFGSTPGGLDVKTREDEQSRKLHPQLRVYRNGSASVNALRAEISGAVTSVPDGFPEATPTASLERLDLGTAQLSTHFLNHTAKLPKSRLGKRPKLEEQPRAKQAFVNVYIELLRESGESGDDRSEATRITTEIQSKLIKVASTVGGTVIQRRHFLSATIPIAYLEDLERDPSVGFVHPAEPLHFDRPRALARREAPTAPHRRAVGGTDQHQDGANVLIGIIDVDGFDFAHEDFLDANGQTRFVTIWDQGGSFRAPPPAPFNYGSEFSQLQLNAAIDASKQPGGLPAHELERQSQREPGSHGTHVTSIAAGNRSVCPKAKIAAVLIDLPRADTPLEERRLTFSDSSRITHAVEYLLEVAKREGLPISINISLGTNGGAHDGSSGVSRWLDALLATPGRAVTVAAGNAGQEAASSEDDLGWTMGRIHTSGQVASRGLDVDLEWTVIGNGLEDVSENELELWYSAQDRFTVMLKPPSATDWIEVKPRQFIENKRLSSGTTVSIYNEQYHPANGANYLTIYLSPNLEQDNIRGVQAGVWKVRLRGEEVRDGRFNGWVERDDPVEIGPIGARRLFRFPSFFSTRSNVDSHSISSLACGHRVIAVANLDTAALSINTSSSQGPTRDGRFKPDIAAPGTNIRAANGFDPDQTWIEMTGTSMASPYVTGVVGLMLSARPKLTAAQCQGILQRTARPLPGHTYVWRNDAGFGQIDPEAAVKEALGFNTRQELR
jgi:subtilisin family serine protease